MSDEEDDGSAITEIIPGLFLTNAYRAFRLASWSEVETLIDLNIKAVLSLEEDNLWKWSQSPAIDHIKPRHHLWIECEDTLTQDLLKHMEEICDFIDQMLEEGRKLSSEPKEISNGEKWDQSDSKKVNRRSGGVLVHSEWGRSRAPTAIIAYLMRKEKRSYEEVLLEVKKKCRVRPHKGFRAQLKVWGLVGYQIWEDADRTIPKPLYKKLLEKRAKELQRLGLTGDEPIGLQSLGD